MPSWSPTVAENAASRAKYLAKLGCSDEATQIARLRSLTAKEIIDAADESWNMIGNTGLSWTPTIDGVVLVDQWINRFRQGKINRVPVMAGNAKDEVRLMGAIYENDNKQKITPAQATTVVKNFFGPKADKVMQEYAISTASEPFGPLCSSLTDALFATGLSADCDALAKLVPLFRYQSTIRTHRKATCTRYIQKSGPATTPICPTCSNGTTSLESDLKFTPEQQALAVAMGRYFGQFAATGDPNTDGLPHWSPTSDGQTIQYLETKSTGGVRSVPISKYHDEHKVAFWKSLMSSAPSKAA